MRAREAKMTQTTNRFFDEVARLMNDAAGVASGVRREFDTLVRSQAERILRDLDVVKREEFEAVKEMARLAREENEALKARIDALETRAAAAESAPKSRKAKSAAAEGGMDSGG
jgi:BMFP domain-containing protein YqiC